MLSAKDSALVYETILTSPGMNDSVKIDLRISRKNVLVLVKLIEWGLSTMNGGTESGLLNTVGKETLSEIKNIPGDLLLKAGLTEMNDKLNSLSEK